LIDLCGICLGDNTQCFFSSLLGAGTVAGITGGVIAAIVIAAIIACLLGIWASRKGYQYYMAKSNMNSAGAVHNPYFKNNQNSGDMIGLDAK